MEIKPPEIEFKNLPAETFLQIKHMFEERTTGNPTGRSYTDMFGVAWFLQEARWTTSATGFDGYLLIRGAIRTTQGYPYHTGLEG